MFFSGLFQRKSDAPVTTPAELADAIGLSYDTYTGKQISSQRAMRLTAVFSCVRVLAESVGMLPCNLYHLNGSLKQRATGERLHKLISTHPNGYMTPQEFWELVVTCLCLRGNFYAYKVKAFGEVAELLPVDPGCVVPKLNSSWEPVYQVTFPDGSADENPRVIRGVVGLAAGLAILKLGLMGVGSAISIVSRIMSMTPIGMIATAIALAAGLIITNWDVVGPYFKKLWETIGPYFEAGWELLKKVFAWSPMGINNWGPVVKWFQDMWDKLKPIIEWFTDSSGDTVDAINSAQWGAGAYDAYGTGIPARGYTPYPAVDPAQANNASDATGSNPFMINKATAPKVDGEIKVSFINMPPGMRVTETRSSGIDINHDVGYTRFW